MSLLIVLSPYSVLVLNCQKYYLFSQNIFEQIVDNFVDNLAYFQIRVACNLVPCVLTEEKQRRRNCEKMESAILDTIANILGKWTISMSFMDVNCEIVL